MTNPQLATVPKDLRHSSSSECTISLSSSANEPTNIPTPFSIYIIILNINISAYNMWITTPSCDLGEHHCSPALHCYFSVLWPEQTWLFCEIIEKWHVTAQTWTTNTWKTGDCKYQAANIVFSWHCSGMGTPFQTTNICVLYIHTSLRLQSTCVRSRHRSGTFSAACATVKR